MCFSFASNCAISCFLFFFCLCTLRFLILIRFSDCFRLVPFPVSESDNRHVYSSTCLFSIFCSVDNSSSNLDILVWMLSARLFTLVSVTMFSLGAECACFFFAKLLFTTVPVAVFFGTLGRFSFWSSLQQQQKSYLKDTTAFINFIERTKVPEKALLVSMDVTSLYTNIPQEEGIQTVCKAYVSFYQNKIPIPTPLLERALRLILQENSFQFNGKNYLQTHGTAMGTKMAVAFANIFMAKVETDILSQSVIKPLVWKRFIDDIFSLWNVSRDEISKFIEQANKHHPTIKFTAEISETETTFLDTNVYKGERFKKAAVLDVCTHFKPTETFQYTHFSSCHPPGIRRGFVKGEALRLLRTSSSKTLFEEMIKNFKKQLQERGYPESFIQNTLSEVNFEDRKLALQQKRRENKRILPFVTQYQPSVPNLKQIIMNKWHLIKKQPLLNEIFKEPPLTSYKKGRSLKDILVRAKL